MDVSSPYLPYILGAYGFTACVVLGLVAHTFLHYKAAKNKSTDRKQNV